MRGEADLCYSNFNMEWNWTRDREKTSTKTLTAIEKMKIKEYLHTDLVGFVPCQADK